MNKELIEKSLAYVEATRSYPLSSGMHLDYETIHELAVRIPIKREILLLFSTNKGLPSSYLCGIKCDMCGLDYQSVLTKTSLIQYIDFLAGNSISVKKHFCEYKPTCVTCIEKKKKQRDDAENALMKKFKEDLIQERTKNTEDLIVLFLSSTARLSVGSTWKDVVKSMSKLLSNCHDEKIKDAIKDLNYNDFLNTPYWKAIAYEVKRKHRFRCIMCDSKERLNVHHKNYSYHGMEHTYEGIKSLTCVCEKCHSKHHGHYE